MCVGMVKIFILLGLMGCSNITMHTELPAHSIVCSDPDDCFDKAEKLCYNRYITLNVSDGGRELFVVCK